MAAKSLRPVAAVRRVVKCLSEHLGERAFVSREDPIQLGAASEPEPGVIVAVPSETEYEDHHPTPAELLLIIEVAESSAAGDRNREPVLYARARVVQYGILNLCTNELEDYRDPGPDGYRSRQTYQAEQSFNLVAFPDVQVEVADLIPLKYQ